MPEPAVPPNASERRNVEPVVLPEKATATFFCPPTSTTSPSTETAHGLVTKPSARSATRLFSVENS